MVKLFVIAFVFALVGTAHARTCNTYCSTYGGQTHCQTTCR